MPSSGDEHVERAPHVRPGRFCGVVEVGSPLSGSRVPVHTVAAMGCSAPTLAMKYAALLVVSSRTPRSGSAMLYVAETPQITLPRRGERGLDGFGVEVGELLRRRESSGSLERTGSSSLERARRPRTPPPEHRRCRARRSSRTRQAGDCARPRVSGCAAYRVRHSWTSRPPSWTDPATASIHLDGDNAFGRCTGSSA